MYALLQVARPAAAFPHLHPAADGASLLLTIAISATLAGLVFSVLAVVLYVRLVNARRTARFELERAAGQIAFRDALLGTGGESVVVLSNETSQPWNSDKGDALLKAAMTGPDSPRVASALGGLIREGNAFGLVARGTAAAEAIAIRGETVSGRAVVFAKSQAVGAAALDYRAVLDAVPTPVWVRGPDMALRWGNRAFLDVTDTNSLQNALTLNASLQHSEIDLAMAALESAQGVEAVRYALVEGTRRVFAMKYVCLPDSTLAATAIDVTEKAQAEGRLRLNTEAAADMLDGLPLAIAVFDEDRRLESCNIAYAGLWGLDETWLETHPTLGEILDRLRAVRKLPEQPDFAAWKAAQLRLFEECAQPHEEFWHLAGGRSLRVVVTPHLLGGLTVVIEDISEKLRLEVSFKLLLQVQRATLDTVEDGIAVFGPDGRLVLFNANFAKLWHFTDEELLAQPHFTKVANLAQGRLGHDGIWSIVSAGITSAEPERCNDWGKAVRADGRVISLSMARLPNGATIATFCDLTDLERFRDEQAKKPHAAA
jgi:PAS domain-containing protein